MPIPAISRLAAKVAGKLPLRTVLIVPFVVQIVGTVGLVGYLSFKSGQESVEDLAQQLMAQVGERVSDRLTNYLQAPQNAVAANRLTVERGLLNINDFEQLQQQLWQQLTLNPSLEELFFGNESGEEIGYGRFQSEELVKTAEKLAEEDLSVGTPFFHILRNTDPGKRKYYLVDSKGNPRKIFYTFEIDNSTTPWFRAAKASKKQTWSPISVFKVVPLLGTVAVTPIYDTAGKWQGVFASSFTLSAPSTFLNQLHFSPSGQVLIMERSGKLVATSTQESLLVKPVTGEPKQLLAVNSKDTLTREIARQLNQKFDNFRTLQETKQLKLVSNHEQQFVRVTPYQDEYGLDWLVVVIVPESDFMAQINANTRTTIMLCLAALVGSIGVGILTARWITKPIVRLNTAAKAIAQGKWEKTVEVNRADEVGQLSQSFNQMAAQLQQYFAQLQASNKSLTESESKLHQIIEAIPVGISIHDLTGKLIYVNDKSRELLGIQGLPESQTEELAVAYHVYQAGTEQLYPVEDMPVVRAIQGEKARVDDIEIRLPERRTPLEVYGTPLWDETGKIVAAIAAFFDITERKQTERILADYSRTLEAQVAEQTAELVRANQQLISEIHERKQAEEALRQSEERWQLAIEGSNDGIWDHNLITNTHFLSSRCLEIVGYNYEEIDTFDKWRNYIHLDDLAFLEETFQKHLNREIPDYSCEYRMRCKNGSYKWLLARGQAHWDEQGNPVRAAGSLTDISDRKRAEEALRRYERIVSATTDAMSLVDRNYVYQVINQTYLTWHHKPYEEIVGHSVSELLGSDVFERLIKEPLDRCLVGETAHYQNWFELAIGRRFLSVIYSPYLEADHTISGVVVSLRDITELKQAEERLQQRNQEMQAIFAAFPDILFRVTADGTILDYKTKDEENLYTSPATFLGKNVQDVLPPPAGQNIQEAVRRVMETDSPVNLEYSLPMPEGEQHFEARMVRLHENEVIAVTRNISDRKLAEVALRESANREHAIAQVIQRMRQSLDINTIFSATTEELRRVIKCDRVAIYQLNPDWSGTFVAESVASGWRTLLLEQNNVPHFTDDILDSENCAVRAWGITNEVIQDTYLQATHGGNYNQGYLATEDIYNAELTPCHIKLLERFQAKAYLIVPIFCGDQLWGLLACYQNLSSRHWSDSEINTVIQIGVQLGVALQQAQLLEETRQQSVALQTAKEAADAANRAKSKFLANMSHELRTPLNGILGYAQILQRDSNCAPKQKEGINIIYQCGNHLLTLINDILDLSKIEAEKLELYPEDINFSLFLAGISEIFQLRAAQKDINFTCLPLSPLPSVIQADEKRLRQVLINLLSNAVKFTENGEVTFKVGYVDHFEGLALTQNSKLKTQNSSQLRFQIEDTGIGIPPEQLEKIFLPFEQVGDSSHRSEGTGLGLAITQKIVEMMGSQIFVESTPGVGSKFWCDLDLPGLSNLIQSIPVKLNNKIIGYQGAKQKILVVDDRWENCSVIINILEPLGFELWEAADGQEGLAKAIEVQPDLIIADLVMPGMDGYQMTQQLRQLPQFQDTIILAISANAFEADRIQSLESGCNDFLTKPIQADALLSKIKHYLNLIWIDDNTIGTKSPQFGNESSHSGQHPQTDMVIPKKEELMALYEATQIGDVQGVERGVMQLQQSHPEYASFATRILELAEEFEYEEIVKLIDCYLTAPSQNAQVTPPDIRIPPLEQLIPLYEAAQIAHITGVQQIATQLNQLFPEYTTFATQVLELAANFDCEEIVQLVARYLPNESE